MTIQLSDHFDYKKLLRLTASSIVMLIVTSLYTIVDGFFISNYAGKTSFAAVNFIMPVLMIVGAVGFMMGTGGGALIAKKLGEQKPEEANQVFSMIIYLSVMLGTLLAVIGLVFLRPIAAVLGAEGELLEQYVLYGRIVLIATPAFVLQYEFQCLFATANKPRLGLIITIAAGLTNAVLDALFIGVFSWGLVGAALATGIGQCVGGVLPVIYFVRRNNSLLRLGKMYYDSRALIQVCLNGSSEMVSSISSSVVGMLYNVQLLKYIGEDGVSAYGVLMYVGMIFGAIFMGFSVGIAPVISYHYGAGNKEELKNLRKRCFRIIGVFAVILFALSLAMAKPLSSIFVGYDKELLALTLRAFYIYSISFLIFGFSIFASSFFTALNNGPVSAGISMCRTLVFEVVTVLVLPMWLGIDGIWWSIVVAEFLSLMVAVVFLVKLRKRYGY
ncbi:MAG: MATE family efflux transporter [Eubacteriales bacterium]|nr:MATE family efflux transporter [Eubacteriales bacterium]